jgi:hypothetical protein
MAVAHLIEALPYKPEGRGFDCDFGNFHWHNPSGGTKILGSNQTLTTINTRNILWGYRWPVHRADNLTTFM